MFNHFIIYAGNFIDSFTVNHYSYPSQFVTVSGGSASGMARTLLANGIKLLLPLILTAALIIIATSGIRYITASGNEEQAGHAKKTLIYGVVGLLLTMFSWTIINIISTEVVPRITTPSIYFTYSVNGGKYTFDAQGLSPESMSSAQVEWQISPAEGSSTTFSTDGSGKSFTPSQAIPTGTYAVSVTATVNKDGKTTTYKNDPTSVQAQFTVSSTGVTLTLKKENLKITGTVGNIEANQVTSIEWTFAGDTNPVTKNTAQGILTETYTFNSSGTKTVTCKVTLSDSTQSEVSATEEIRQGDTQFSIDVTDAGSNGYTKKLELKGTEEDKVISISWEVKNSNYDLSITKGSHAPEYIESSSDTNKLLYITFEFPRDGSYDILASVDYETDSDEPTEPIQGSTTITTQPKISCEVDSSLDTQANCSLEDVNLNHIDSIEWETGDELTLTDAEKITETVEGKTLTTGFEHNYIYPGSYQARATINYNPSVSSEAQIITGVADLSLAEGIVVDQVATTGTVYYSEWKVSNLNKDTVSSITCDCTYLSTDTRSRSYSSVTGSFQGSSTYVFSYIFPGGSHGYQPYVKVIFNNGTEAEEQASASVPINDPEPVVTMQAAGTVGFETILVSQYGVFNKEVAEITLTILPLTTPPSTEFTYPLTDGDTYVVPKGNYDVNARILYKNGYTLDAVPYQDS